MDQSSDSMKDQVTALMRVINAADKEPCKIVEGLYMGSIGAANNTEALRQLNITHILTVVSLRPEHASDFVHKVIPVVDIESTNIAQYFGECIDFIDEARGHGSGVLVHCFAGRSRSVTIVVAYLMKKKGMCLSKALDHVRSKRPQASPNAGFILQLQEFERSLQDPDWREVQEKCQNRDAKLARSVTDLIPREPGLLIHEDQNLMDEEDAKEMALELWKRFTRAQTMECYELSYPDLDVATSRLTTLVAQNSGLSGFVSRTVQSMSSVKTQAEQRSTQAIAVVAKLIPL